MQRVAEAIYKSRHSEWRGFIPRSIELRYRRMAEAALAELNLREETRTLADGMGGVGTNWKTGVTTVYSRPCTRLMRLVSPWRPVGQEQQQ